MDISRIFNPKFIFDPSLPAMSKPFALSFYIFFIVLIVLALAAYGVAKRQQKLGQRPIAKLWQKLTNCFLYMGLIGLLLVFFRQQQVYFLSMPVFYYLWLIGFVVWLYFIVRWIRVRMKKIVDETREKEEKMKYIK